MNLKRGFRVALTAALLCVCLAVTAYAQSYGTGTVTCSVLNMRRSATTNSAVIASATRNTKVTVLENQSNGWYKVNLNGTVG